MEMFKYEEKDVRTQLIENEVYFNLKDVCEILEIGNPSQALTRLNKDGVISNEGVVKVGYKANGEKYEQIGQMNFINESNLYKLIFQSRKPQAEKFTEWVTSEVLPSIRRHGAYMTKETLNKAITSPDFLIELATNLKAEQERNNRLATKIEEDKPKVVFADALLISDKSILINELAKILAQNGIDIGGRRLFGWLRLHGYLCSRGEEYNLPTQYSMNLGLMEVKRSVHNNPDGSSKVNRTPKITAKGQQYFINKFKKMKALEEQFVRY